MNGHAQGYSQDSEPGQSQHQRQYRAHNTQSQSHSQASHSHSQDYHSNSHSQSHDSQHQSVMEDASDDSSGSDFETSDQGDISMDGGRGMMMEMDPAQQRFYAEQQQQARYYQQHQMINGGVILGTPGAAAQRKEKERDKNRDRANGMASNGDDGDDGRYDDEDDDDDDSSSTMSIPDANINFNLTYALHTFLATVEGQASVVKGDSLQLLDDANSYWWLVRVLKTEDVGYIPAENIETPYERLARLNKHRNVDLAQATHQEKTDGEVQGREKLRAGLSGKSKSPKNERSGSSGSKGEGRKVIFAPPTYVEPSIRTWSSDEEGSGDEDEEDDEPEMEDEQDQRQAQEVSVKQMMDMEPDDGVEWADQAVQDDQRRTANQGNQGQQQQVQAKSNNPFAQQRAETQQTQPQPTSPVRDPAEAGDGTRRITVTPAVAQSSPSAGVLLPSAVVANDQRKVSEQSTHSVNSVSSAVSIGKSNGPASPEDKKGSKIRKSVSHDDLQGSERGEKKEKKRGMLGGLFSRKSKDKKGISSNDARTSEDSIASGAIEGSPNGGRQSEEAVVTIRAPTPADRRNGAHQVGESPPGVSTHSLRLQQKDQATMQAYSTKYLKGSPTSDVRSPTASEAAAAVAQSAAAMRLAASMHGATNRPSSVIVSPNPAAPLLNVMRIFAGEHIKSDASFKTVLLNDSTGATDLIRQAVQRFRLPHASQPGIDKNFYLTIKDINGEELELELEEKPLAVFLAAVQRYADEDGGQRARAITPTVKRSSVSSISSVVSLSSHPAIAKLGMNDFSDDSAVKIYLNRRRPGSRVFGSGSVPESTSEFGSYSSHLSTVQEGSPDPNTLKSGMWSTDSTPPSALHSNEPGSGSPRTASMRYNPSLTVNTTGHASPERFTSPSARFTIKVVINAPDLPDGLVFDPVNDAIISKQVLRDRLAAGHPSQAPRDLPLHKRQRFFVLPRNATVLEAIEQGLERLGIQEGVVDGGDDVEERGGKRVGQRTRYSLVTSVGGKERVLAPSSKLLDAYATPPSFKPVERSTPEQRRRSRDWSYNLGAGGDILPTDPVFELRRSALRQAPIRQGSFESRSISQPQQQLRTDQAPPVSDPRNGAMSPQEIIAAQRAASRANQKALISAHSNQSQGVDIVLPNKGTLRSSRLMQPGGEVVRYSYIDGDGETYDISDLLEEEWGPDGSQSSPHISSILGEGEKMETLRPPGPSRKPTDQSVYVTAPSTPEPTAKDPLEVRRGSGSHDLLKGVVERSAGKPEGRLEEKLSRVIDKVKTSRLSVQDMTAPPPPVVVQSSSPEPRSPVVGGARSTTPNSASATSQSAARALSPLLEAKASGSPNPSITSMTSSNTSRAANFQNTAASVNRIISRHKQQPSIASIMSDLSGGSPHDEPERHHQGHQRDRSITPNTASSSSHPTPPLGTAIFTRSVSAASTRPRMPIKYTDDFGMRTLMGLVEARAREMKPKPATSRVPAGHRNEGSGDSNSPSPIEVVGGQDTGDHVTKLFWGERLDKQEIADLHPEIRSCLGPLQSRLDAWDAELDEMLSTLGGMMRPGSRRSGSTIKGGV